MVAEPCDQEVMIPSKTKLRRVSTVGYPGLNGNSVPCAHYCVGRIWRKLSISVVAVRKKLRRLSSVGRHAL